MDWETYREWTRTTVTYPKEKEEEYLMVGLANEVGELLGKYKKEIRGDGEKFEEKIDELGVEYLYLQFVSITGKIMGKGIPADHWETVAERGFQLV